MAEQLSFDLPAKTVLGRDDFFVSPANAMAVAMIDTPETWPDGKLALTGPAGAGKTHLTHVWADRCGAVIQSAAGLRAQDIPSLAQGPVAVEDIPDIASDPEAQQALFHLHNLLLAEDHQLLMTGRATPNLWNLSLPDLQSRVQAAAHIALEAPDDGLLAAVLAKLFADRQITPRPDVIPYLLQRMDRSFQTASQIVESLDRAAMAQGRTVSRRLAAQILDSAGAKG